MRRIPPSVAGLLALACASAAPPRVASDHKLTPDAPPPSRLAPRVEGPKLNLPTELPDGYGQAAPTLLISSSPTGSWLVACQARTDSDGNGLLQVLLGPHGELGGDQLVPYFLGSAGQELELDRYLGHDPTGRYLALQTGGRVLLLDSHLGTSEDLSAIGADHRADSLRYLPHRSFAFSPDGQVLAYVRRQGPRDWVVLRELHSGLEQLLDPQAPIVWRLRFESGGHWLRIDTATEDTNQNGHIGWGSPPAPEGDSGCPSPIPSFPVPAFPSDATQVALYDRVSSTLRYLPDFVAAAGETYIERSEAGELWQADFTGWRQLVSSEVCQGRVLAFHARSSAVLFGCSGGYGQRRDMFLRTRTQRKALGIELAPFEVDEPLELAGDTLILNPKNAALVLDFNTTTLTTLTDGTTMLSGYGATLLAERNGRLYWVSAGGTETAVGMRRPTLGSILRRGPWVALGPQLLNLESRRSGGVFPEPPLALSEAGQGLLPASVDELIPLGPLRWVPPLPEPEPQR